MALKRILIIEDDSDILELMAYNLTRNGYEVEMTDRGEVGLEKALNQYYDLALLDVMLPGVDGLEVCKKIRSKTHLDDLPIIMLTAKSEETDIVVGLELGADDYITKPFNINELLARIRAILRRKLNRPAEGVQGQPHLIRLGPILIDSDSHEAYLDDTQLNLTLTEFKLFLTLAKRPGKVFTREQLLNQINDEAIHVVDRNIDVHIRSIRKKLGLQAELIATVRGVGYKSVHPQ